MASQQFCVKWNSYSSNLQNVFPRLLTNEHFVDITLACEGQMIKCHKVVLSACSTYFEKLLVHNPCQHPIIFMKDMKHWEVQALVDFMYKGEVNVNQDELNSLLVAAEALQIRGLCGTDGVNPQSVQDRKHDVAEAVSLPKGIVVSGRDSPAATKRRRMNHTEDYDHTPKISSVTSMNSSVPASSETNSFTADTSHILKTEANEEHLRDSSHDKAAMIKQEVDLDDTFLDGDLDGEVQEEEFTNYDHHNDSDSIHREVKPLAGTLDQPGPSGLGAQANSATADLTAAALQNVFCLYNSSSKGAGNTTQDGTPATPGTRVRRSEAELKKAAECVSKGMTFQNVSDIFNIPISTIRFYMARRGILPQRRRGRSSHNHQHSSAGSMMAHYKLPDLEKKDH